jgi:cytidyltransferase-like protein
MAEGRRVLVLGDFDDLRSQDVRFLEEASRLGDVGVLLLSDEAIRGAEGHQPGFPQAERRYVVEAIRYVSHLIMVEGAVDTDALPAKHAVGPAVWAVRERQDTPGKRAFCDTAGLGYVVIPDSELGGFPLAGLERSAAPGVPPVSQSGRKKVLVTGCFDWLHSGHVRFFEEVADLGDLYVIVGHDRNIKLLKGEGHPMHPEGERLYMVGCIRHVKEALLTSGYGWLDAEAEIERIRPDIYVVNEDGDRPEKRKYCEAHGIEYRVLRRLPKEGLPARQSTDLRGF